MLAAAQKIDPGARAEVASYTQELRFGGGLSNVSCADWSVGQAGSSSLLPRASLWAYRRATAAAFNLSDVGKAQGGRLANSQTQASAVPYYM